MAVSQAAHAQAYPSRPITMPAGLPSRPTRHAPVTPEDEAVARRRLAESVKRKARQATVPPPQAVPKASPIEPAAENEKPPAPKGLSLADLREAGRRRRETAA